jgi:hypothetical protein
MRPFFMSYVWGEDRGQAALLPAAIEDYVAADAPVRVSTLVYRRLSNIYLMSVLPDQQSN